MIFSEVQRADKSGALEILEILVHENLYLETSTEITAFLRQKTVAEPELKKLIQDGFYLIHHPIEKKLVN